MFVDIEEKYMFGFWLLLYRFFVVVFVRKIFIYSGKWLKITERKRR